MVDCRLSSAPMVEFWELLAPESVSKQVMMNALPR